MTCNELKRFGMRFKTEDRGEMDIRVSGGGVLVNSRTFWVCLHKMRQGIFCQRSCLRCWRCCRSRDRPVVNPCITTSPMHTTASWCTWCKHTLRLNTNDCVGESWRTRCVNSLSLPSGFVFVGESEIRNLYFAWSSQNFVFQGFGKIRTYYLGGF